jgi:hypothetical protein
VSGVDRINQPTYFHPGLGHRQGFHFWLFSRIPLALPARMPVDGESTKMIHSIGRRPSFFDFHSSLSKFGSLYAAYFFLESKSDFDLKSPKMLLSNPAYPE